MSGKPGAFSVDGSASVSAEDVAATLRSLSKFGITKRMIREALDERRELVDEWWEVHCDRPSGRVVVTGIGGSAAFGTRSAAEDQKAKRRNRYDVIVHVRRYRLKKGKRR